MITRHASGNRAQLLDLSNVNRGPAGLAPFRTLTQFMQVIYCEVGKEMLARGGGGKRDAPKCLQEHPRVPTYSVGGGDVKK